MFRPDITHLQPENIESMKIKLFTALLCLSSVFLSGCATLDSPTDPSDPFESYNRSIDTFNNTLDRYILKPVAQGYDAVAPAPVQTGVNNFFSNLDDILVIFNDLFQFKFKQFASDTGRLLVNSTVGVFGLIDWASDIGLEKHNEDFGQTLGYWGVPSGPYLILPFFGPGTVRDTINNNYLNLNLNPINNEVEAQIYPNLDSKTVLGLTLVNLVDIRAGLLKAEGVVGEAALDRYLYIRELYLQKRRNLVHDGNPPNHPGVEEDDEFDEADIFED